MKWLNSFLLSASIPIKHIQSQPKSVTINYKPPSCSYYTQKFNFHLKTYLETLVQPHLYSFSLIMIGNLPWRRSCCPLKEFEALLPMVMSNRNRIENKTNIENKLLHFLSFENPLPKFHFNPLTPNRGKIFNLHIWYFKINNRFHSVFNDG